MTDMPPPPPPGSSTPPPPPPPTVPPTVPPTAPPVAPSTGPASSSWSSGSTFGGTPPPPIDPKRSSDGGGRAIIVVAAVGVLALVALVGAVVVLLTGGDDDQAVESAPAPAITVPTITVPTFTVPDIALPTITVPDAETPVDPVSETPGVTVPGITIPAITVPVITAPESVVVDLFTGTGAAEVIDEVAAARGADPLRILRAVVYPEYAFVQVQDPTVPENVDEYQWRGTLAEPSPVRLVGTGDLEENLYSADEADWAIIPALVAAAPTLTEIPDGAVTHVIVERPLPFSVDVRMRVFVNGERNSGYVDADALGNVLDVTRS